VEIETATIPLTKALHERIECAGIQVVACGILATVENCCRPVVEDYLVTEIPCTVWVCLRKWRYFPVGLANHLLLDGYAIVTN
jgi:hypothetical protein